MIKIICHTFDTRIKSSFDIKKILGIQCTPKKFLNYLVNSAKYLIVLTMLEV